MQRMVVVYSLEVGLILKLQQNLLHHGQYLV